MDCKEVCNLTDDYVFGLLEPDVEREVTSHLSSCGSCAGAVEQARSRRQILSAWEAPGARGAADRLLVRIRSGQVAARSRYEYLLVRLMAAAAVIAAAVVLPIIFMAERPAVRGERPKTTIVKDVFHDTIRQIINMPADDADSYLHIRLRSADGKSPVRATARLNEGDSRVISSGASQSSKSFLFNRQHGLREGRNELLIENLGPGPLEFEVTVVSGSSK